MGFGKDPNRWLEHSNLTSAITFARDHVSIWRSLTPTAEIFVRRLNAHLYEREYRALESTIDPNRRAFINEVAFRLFALAMIGNWNGSSVPDEFFQRALREVRQGNERIYAADAAQTKEPDEAEKREILHIYGRTRSFFLRVSIGQKIEIYPRFAGCGILDTCAGDVYFPATLFEVKAGDRSFRSVDIRQLLVYAALNKSEQARALTRIGLFNPRTGISFHSDLDELCLDISGRPGSDLLAEIVRIVSSGDISR